MTLITRASLALAALATAALIACGDGEAGDETPTPTLTATSTATPGSETGAGALPTDTATATATSGQQTYEVVEGDTIFGIAAELGVDAATLMEANDISDPTLLQIGQILVIPSGDAPAAPTAAGTATATATPGG